MILGEHLVEVNYLQDFSYSQLNPHRSIPHILKSLILINKMPIKNQL